MNNYQRSTSAPSWLFALACIALVGGIIGALVLGNSYGELSGAMAWAVFWSGLCSFAFFGALGAIVERLTDIRYLIALQVKGDAPDVAGVASTPSPKPPGSLNDATIR